MRLLGYLLYSQNWNIGFVEQTPESLIKDKRLGRVQWMRHSYKDRWFADPFILKVTDEEIVVFVEECKIKQPKGILCELVLDRQTKTLKQRYVLLELDTHLSYPAIIRKDGKVYVYPENGASGKLYIYEYDEKQHRLINPVCILEEAVADSTILQQTSLFFLIATKYPETQEKSFLYCSDGVMGPFKEINRGRPVQENRKCSRPAGNWMSVCGQLYRPAQDCVERYGAALSILEVLHLGGEYEEKLAFQIPPQSWRYNLGIHTINYYDDYCVVDSVGYLYPVLAKFIMSLIKFKHRIGL